MQTDVCRGSDLFAYKICRSLAQSNRLVVPCTSRTCIRPNRLTTIRQMNELFENGIIHNCSIIRLSLDIPLCAIFYARLQRALVADLLGTTSLGRRAVVHARVMEESMTMNVKQSSNGRRPDMPFWEDTGNMDGLMLSMMAVGALHRELIQ